jgi:hypothetical protein
VAKKALVVAVTATGMLVIGAPAFAAAPSDNPLFQQPLVSNVNVLSQNVVPTGNTNGGNGNNAGQGNVGGNGNNIGDNNNGGNGNSNGGTGNTVGDGNSGGVGNHSYHVTPPPAISPERSLTLPRDWWPGNVNSGAGNNAGQGNVGGNGNNIGDNNNGGNGNSNGGSGNTVGGGNSGGVGNH